MKTKNTFALLVLAPLLFLGVQLAAPQVAHAQFDFNFDFSWWDYYAPEPVVVPPEPPPPAPEPAPAPYVAPEQYYDPGPYYDPFGFTPYYEPVYIAPEPVYVPPEPVYVPPVVAPVVESVYVPPPPPPTCDDSSATNYGGTAPCTYAPAPAPVISSGTCGDPQATNLGGALPCTYPPLVCNDSSANNFGGALPCTYNNATYCTTGLGGEQAAGCTTNLSDAEAAALAARYAEVAQSEDITGGADAFIAAGVPIDAFQFCDFNYCYSLSGTPTQIQRDATGRITSVACSNGGTTTAVYSTCQDPSATNKGSALPCTYEFKCLDPNATNYNGSRPCTYPPPPPTTCQDVGADNFGKNLPCTYAPKVCEDPQAKNTGKSLPCTYPPVVTTCKDINATNYGGALPCTYPPPTCQDPNSNNFGGALPCTYPPAVPQTCQDPAANNIGQPIPCRYSAQPQQQQPQQQQQSPATTASLSANPSEIDSGQSSTLSWSSSHATSCSSAGGFTTGGATSGSVSTGALTTTSNFQVICSGPSGNSAPSIATVTVNQPQASISASPSRLHAGETTTITWSAAQVQSCSVSGPGLSSTALSGSRALTVSSQSVYTITCQTKSSPVTDTVTVNVIPGFQEF